MSSIENFGNQSLPSCLKDPFGKISIKSIGTYSYISDYSEKWVFTGTVKFENGDTKGEQAFSGNSFDEVVLKMKSFFEELK